MFLISFPPPFPSPFSPLCPLFLSFLILILILILFYFLSFMYIFHSSIQYLSLYCDGSSSGSQLEGLFICFFFLSLFLPLLSSFPLFFFSSESLFSFLLYFIFFLLLIFYPLLFNINLYIATMALMGLN